MEFDRQPVLEGSLVALRPLRADDHAALYAVASDRLIWEQHPDKTRSEPDGFRHFFEEALASGGALVALDAASRRVIGTSRFHGHDAARSEIEIGWSFLGRRYWGGRYNGEMKRLMLEHAFQYVARVVFLIAPHNYRSQRAVEKIGAVRTGSRLSRGQESLVFQIEAADYARAGARAPPG